MSSASLVSDAARRGCFASPSVLLFVLASAATTSGCFHAGVGPRTADVLPAGGVAGGAMITLASFAPGKFGTERGNTAQRGPMSPMLIMGALMQNVSGFVRVGATDHVELQTNLGFQEIAFGARVGVLQERDADSLSVAMGAMACYRPSAWGEGPLFRADAFGGRATLDVSRWVSDSAAIVINPTVSFGPEGHAITANRKAPCRGFGSPGCGEYGPAPYAYALRHEIRLTVPVGTALQMDGNTLLTGGIAPYYTPRAGTLEDFKCSACDAATHRPFEENWGFHFVVGAEDGAPPHGQR